MNDEKNTSEPHSRRFKLLLAILPPIIAGIFGFAIAWLTLSSDSKTGSTTITQGDSSQASKVTGNHNINVQNAERDVHIGDINIITINQLSDVRGAADTLIKNATTEKTYTAQEFMDEVNKKRKQRELSTTEQEAENQADDFLTTLTFQLAKETERKKRYKSRLEALPGACKLIFSDFIVSYIDSYVGNLKKSELAKQYNLDQLTIEHISDIKDIFDQKGVSYTIRIIRFPNRDYVKISFQTGAIIEKKVREYPAMRFAAFDTKDNEIREGSFYILKRTGGGFFSGGIEFPTPNDKGELDDGFYEELKNFKKRFKEQFDEMIVKVISYES